jgi:hypothetical protein
MLRNLAVASVAATLIGTLPAQAQEIPELAGGPGSRAAEQEVARQIAAQNKAMADKIKADQATLAKQSAAQKTEQARLAKLAEDLKAREARLEARAAELAAEERSLVQLRNGQKSAQAEDFAAREARLEAREAELAVEERRLAQLEADLKSDNASTLADLIRETDEAREEAALGRQQQYDDAPADPGNDDRPRAPAQGLDYASFDFDSAERSCARAGEDAAQARSYYSARYDTEPRLQRNGGWQLFGWMRLTDRRGYVVVRTVCALDDDGDVQHFAFLR